MTFRVEDSEVPPELHDLGQCFRSGAQALPLSPECTNVLLCWGVVMYIWPLICSDQCT